MLKEGGGWEQRCSKDEHEVQSMACGCPEGENGFGTVSSTHIRVASFSVDLSGVNVLQILS